MSKEITPNVLIRGVEIQIRLDSRLKHAGMTDFKRENETAENLTRRDWVGPSLFFAKLEINANLSSLRDNDFLTSHAGVFMPRL
jgi:hypothetical protein